MRLSNALLVAFATAGSCFPGEVKPSDWMPKGPNDVRSPCPGLNSLANHGFLPHSGKGLTMDILKKGFKDGINVGPDFAEFAGKMGIELSNDPGKKFDLNDLNVHNAIEHDSSLSRQDAYFGDFHTFNKTVFDGTAEHFQGKVIDVPIIAKARCDRIRDSKKRNPHFVLNHAHRQGGLTEASLIVSLFGNPTTGIVEHPEYVTYWFRNRRLPYELGWHKRAQETNLKTLGKMIEKVHDATPEDCVGTKLGPNDNKFLVH